MQLYELRDPVRSTTDPLGHVSSFRAAYIDYQTKSCREQVCQVFPKFRSSKYLPFLFVHQSHCNNVENGKTIMESWLVHKDSTKIENGLLDLFYEARDCEDLALAISVMLIIRNNSVPRRALAVNSRFKTLLNSFTPPGDYQVFFHHLATSFGLMLDQKYDRTVCAPIVSWLLDVKVEKQHYEAARDLSTYCLGRLAGWPHAKALSSDSGILSHPGM